MEEFIGANEVARALIVVLQPVNHHQLQSHIKVVFEYFKVNFVNFKNQ